MRFQGSGLPTVTPFPDSVNSRVRLRYVRLEIARRNETFRLFYDYVGAGSGEITGNVSRDGNRPRFDARTGSLSDLLLPSRGEGTDFRLRIERGAPVRLVAQGDDLLRSEVDLRPYIDQPSVRGRPVLTFVRQ